MAKLAYVQSDSRPKGIRVAVLFKVEKVRGWSLKFNNQAPDEKGKWVDREGKMMDIQFGESMLVLPNDKKRSGINSKTQKEYRDPDFNVLAYPDEAAAKDGVKNEKEDVDAKEGEEVAR